MGSVKWEGATIISKLWRGLGSTAKYMSYGVLAAIIAGLYFADGQGTFITIIAISLLITSVVVSRIQINELKDRLFNIENNFASMKDLDHATESIDKEFDNTNTAVSTVNEKVNFIAQAASEQIDTLAGNVSDDMRELLLMVAENRYGPEQGGEGDNV